MRLSRRSDFVGPASFRQSSSRPSAQGSDKKRSWPHIKEVVVSAMMMATLQFSRSSPTTMGAWLFFVGECITTSLSPDDEDDGEDDSEDDAESDGEDDAESDNDEEVNASGEDVNASGDEVPQLVPISGESSMFF